MVDIYLNLFDFCSKKECDKNGKKDKKYHIFFTPSPQKTIKAPKG